MNTITAKHFMRLLPCANNLVRFMHTRQHGFITLLGVLIVGAIGTTITLSLLVLGVGSSQTSFSLEQSNKAKALANACAEHALNQLRLSPAYIGNEPYAFTGHTCQISPVQVSGGLTTIRTSATVGDTTRKVEMILSQIQPSIIVSSWQEKDF